MHAFLLIAFEWNITCVDYCTILNWIVKVIYEAVS